MLTTTTSARWRGPLRPHTASPSRITALSVALDEAHARLGAALVDLRTLVSDEALSPDDAAVLEAEVAGRHLRRVAALEERGALACTPEEWQRFTLTAARRRASRRGAAARGERARHELAARQCLVVAHGRVLDPFVAALDRADPDAELLEIRAELATAQLL